MYITCGDPIDGGPSVEPVETGYVPNNPLFSLQLDSPQECSAAICGSDTCSFHDNPSLPGLQDCGSCLDHNGILSSQTGLNSNYWNEDMSFSSLPPLDIEPLPSLFSFSPCSSSYKADRPIHDVADVLLSLKHPAVLKQSQESPSQLTGNPYGQPQASLSYTVHPQMLVSPGGHHHLHHHHQSPTPTNGIGGSGGGGVGGVGGAYSSSSNYYDNGACMQHPPMYPSMSVNVSMNMTMHGYGAADVPVQCSQVQWPVQNTGSSVNVLYPPLLSPGAYPNGATYSFTADFRPQSATSTNSSLNGLTAAEQKPQSPTKQFYHQTYPISKSPVYNVVKVKSPKEINYEEEDSGDGLFSGDQKPNLCRLCGKTYARPSTLKTHLRTHSGERPYRCPDCNKSFSQAANLTAHMRTHTGQKPFRCPICDRRFSQSSSVTTHMRTHSGERPYRCKACRKAFSDSSTLTKHLRIHSGEKPYQCKLCLLRFSQSGNLNRHMRVHGTNGTLMT